MHFSTKERVPLLVCLEVREVHLPPSLTALVRAGSGMMSGSGGAATAAVAAGTGSSGTRTALGGGGGGGGGDDDRNTAGGRAAGEQGGGDAVAKRGGGVSMAGEAEHAGEAGLMDRFRGTVRSFVKVCAAWGP